MKVSSQVRLLFSRMERLLILVVLLFWLICWIDWTWTHRIAETGILWFGLSLPLLILLRWVQYTRWPTRRKSGITDYLVVTLGFIFGWQLLNMAAEEYDAFAEYGPTIGQVGIAGLFLLGLGWVIVGMERWSPQKNIVEVNAKDLGPDVKRFWLLAFLFPVALPFWAATKAKPVRAVSLLAVGFWIFIATLCFPGIWFGTLFLVEKVGVSGERALEVTRWVSYICACSPVLTSLCAYFLPDTVMQELMPIVTVKTFYLSDAGRIPTDLAFLVMTRLVSAYLGAAKILLWKPIAYGVGTAALTWGGWTYWRKSRYRDADERYLWNPFNREAWYYGQRQPKLNQSLSGLLGYSGFFALGFFVMTNLGGCQETFDLPAGGGEQEQLVQVVQVKKVIKKKYVINPFSHINIKIPDIDQIQFNFNEMTRHVYTVGYGKGTGAGFAGGKKGAKVRFIRLEYSGGDWDQDFGVGADLNMLIQYGVRTSQNVEDKTESRTISQLDNFDKGPAMVFMTGQRNISLSRSEVKILREYLLERHGMLFCDNGGSPHFHNQFLSMMREVLPNVRPVKVPLDDRIHSIPYKIPFLPYVVPHGGKDALGWKVDGRWVAYYHPGDIGDAWADGHAGVRPEIWEACYQLGTNVIFYAYTEYSKWMSSQEKR